MTNILTYLLKYKRKVLCVVIMGTVVLMFLQEVSKSREQKYEEKERLRYLHNILEWPFRQETTCGGNFTGYAHKFFRMKSAIYEPDADSFQLACKNGQLPPSYTFIDNDYGVGKYLLRIKHMSHATISSLAVQDDVTIIVDRCNAHNYFHNMQEWYNLFLLSKYFDYNFKDLRVFVIDRSISLHSDVHWKLLFPRLTRAKDVKSPIQFKDALFNIAGPGSPWYYPEHDIPPYIEDFSKTFLSIFNLKSNKILDCKNLTITLYIRRDYYLHPGEDLLNKRNTQRKFKNEAELLETLKKGFAEHNIQTFVAEDMTLQKQLELIIDTDILLGMHGCVFSNTLFMPKHSAIFEMYPKYWKTKPFFREIARWRGIQYKYWRNEKKENEYQDYYTYVPPKEMLTHVNEMKNRIGCGP